MSDRQHGPLAATIQANATAAVVTLDHDRGTKHATSDFHQRIFDDVYGAFSAALADHTERKARMRVVSCPVGTGKTTFGVACVAGLINSIAAFEAQHGYTPSALFVVELVTKADELYRDLCKLIGADKVAVWTREHDAAQKVAVEERKLVDGPAATFTKDALARYPVAIVTHRLFRGKNGHQARVTADGRTRTVTLIDEQIKEVTIYDTCAAEIHLARNHAIECVEKSGPESAAVRALAALDALTSFTWGKEVQTDAASLPPHLLEPLENAEALKWFATAEARRYARGFADDTLVKVFGLGQALADASMSTACAASRRWSTVVTPPGWWGTSTDCSPVPSWNALTLTPTKEHGRTGWKPSCCPFHPKQSLGRRLERSLGLIGRVTVRD
jgi:hypothetical protein